MPQKAVAALEEAIRHMRHVVRDLDVAIAQLEDHAQAIQYIALGKAMPGLKKRARALPDQTVRTRIQQTSERSLRPLGRRGSSASVLWFST